MYVTLFVDRNVILFHAQGMLPNVELYLPYLDDLALSSAEKEELVGIVWRLMEHQVNQAFDGDADKGSTVSVSTDVH